MGRVVTYLLTFAVIAAVYLTGQLDFVERRLMDLRFRMTQTTATTDMVVVGIDPVSLEEIGVWPWPRRLHAQLLDRLVDSGARTVVFNIDFSSTTTEEDDAAFEAALERAGGHAVLPVFVQPLRADDEAQLAHTGPLLRFRQHVRLASANISPAPDGMIRAARTSERWGSGEISTLSAVLAGLNVEPRQAFDIDYGVRPDSITQVSFTDVLQGRVDPAVFRGKRVLIGPAAIELGGQVPVPVWTVASGTMVHALAAQTLAQGRVFRHLPPWVTLLAAALIMAGVAFWGPIRSWQAKIAAMAGIIASAFGLALVAHVAGRFVIDISPALLAGLMGIGTNLALQLNEQKARLITQAFTLRRQDDFLRRVVESIFDGLITFDDNGSITSFNPAAAKIFGITADEAVGRPIKDLIVESEGGPAQTIEDALGPFLIDHAPREALGRSKNGETFPIEFAVSAMHSNKTTAYVVSVRDIGNRKTAERSALEAQRRLAEAIESMSDPLAIFDANDRLLICNSKFERLYHPASSVRIAGSKYEEILQELATLGLLAETAGGSEAWLERRLAHHRSPGEPLDERMQDGSWYRIEEQRTSDGGTVQVLTEVTDLKRREAELITERDEAELANRTKSQFIAGVSHELRTPLNAIIGFADIMKSEMMGPLGAPRYCDYADDIFGSALDLLNTINDVLDVARIEAGKIPLREEDICLEDVVGRAVSMVRGQADERQIALHKSVDEGLPGLNADPRLVRQVLTNLLVNAVRHTHSGGRVEVTATQRPDGGLTAVVTDTGIGIAKKDLERVMRPYERAGKAPKQDFGTGLGLPLVRAFVELHGGRFELQSEIGVGTKAVVDFPAERTIVPSVMTA